MGDVEIPKWLEGLPLAPEFRPTDTEFADPIAYISKIEKEASAFGICKVIPPLPKPSKKYVLYNLNKSLSKSPELGLDGNVGSSVKTDNVGGDNDGGLVRAVFTTRHQELGQSGKRMKAAAGSQPVGAQRQVWQSGEVYTLEQFEAKSKNFAKSQLGMVKEVSPLVIETLFWEAASEKPIYVEYANDVPGSGFGEPEGSLRNVHRRRRRRRKRGTFDRNKPENSGIKKDSMDNTNGNVYGNSVDKDSTVSNLQTGVSCASTSSLSDHSADFSRHQCSNASNPIQGTAGWKLSNSPWNLQVIARSPGSLTRFMPDDIPGVTSPMVYIGMLFSWFAWHVEDHELHSLNYLHIGSPKTWYAVPGDYAFTFEEVIRFHAYGGNTKRLDALTLLGEKTTLLSPEVIVASGIPCCRLVQNPGEFVVTFPRAYHVGFSHGFNCGEAANFGTPRWLTVAKEAAVRRAAMNYLPMLSHQQLLYLLTMSFISRVPRSLLPGARSSRLRDRQKEGRELSVKKAFIDDILKENHLLTILIQKNPSYHVVLWDLDLLPSSRKESQLVGNTLDKTSRESNQSDNQNNQDLYTQMSLYMENVNDFYTDDADDLLYDYHVDSGTLPCVACGILGFPFMAVIQPSQQASRDLLAENQDMIQQLGVSKPLESESLGLKGRAEGSAADAGKVNEGNLLHQPNEASLPDGLTQSMVSPGKVRIPEIDRSSSLEDGIVSSTVKPDKGWNLSDAYLRPRIFCLEHAIQTVDLLHPKGGANVLGICHSDFQKIKAHAAIVAEEACSPFTYNEIRLDSASQGDLNLIDHATDDQENDESPPDWTSKLSISLQHCVKMRRHFPMLNVQHALTLDGLFPDTTLGANAMKWQSRRLRSKRNSNPPSISKSSLSIQIEKVYEPGAKPDGRMARKEDKVMIQYYRRKYKSKHSDNKEGSKMSVEFVKLHPEELSDADFGDSYKMSRDAPESIHVGVENAEKGRAGLSSSSPEETKLQHEDQVISAAKSLSKSPFASQVMDSFTTTALIAENMETQTENIVTNEVVEMNKGFDSPCRDAQELSKIQVAKESADIRNTANSENSAGSPKVCVYTAKNSGFMRQKNITSQMDDANRMHDVVKTDESGRLFNDPGNGDHVIQGPLDPFNSCSDANDSIGERCNEHVKTTGFDECGTSSSLLSCSTLNNEVQQQMQNEKRDNQEHSVSSNVPPRTELPGETNAHQQLHSSNQSFSFTENREFDGSISSVVPSSPAAKPSSKRKREAEMLSNDHNLNVFIRSPCEGLRPRAKRDAPGDLTCGKNSIDDKTAARKVIKGLDGSARRRNEKEQLKRGSHSCEVEGCRMSFQTKAELALHMRNRCHVEGCGKKFNSHKYAILHRRVHDDDRPLKCTWKGCTMTFKWAWARTEHLRVHTGERPYKCKVEGCGLTFRFVSDFSRHRRKTGHYINQQENAPK